MIEDFLMSGTLMSMGGKTLLLGWGKHYQNKEARSGEINFYFPDFFLKEPNPWYAWEHTCEISIEDLIQKLATNQSSKCHWSSPHKTLFENTFNEIQELIKAKVLDKAVPFVFDCSREVMSEKRVRSSLVSLLNYAQQNPVHLYGFWDSSEGILGATPEILFVREASQKGILKTVACAGTKKRDPSCLDALLNDQKELREHRFVVEGIVSSLKSFGQVLIGNPKIVHLKHLSHLLTEIALELESEFEFDAIVKALHPTPALGTYPKSNGIPWLNSYQQKLDRKRFGAPTGFLYKNEARCYVAIRNVQWENDQLSLGAGCGIVEGSQLEREWQEIQLKIQSIKEILAL
jgi:menaquinone-specific isochorismate synthase